MVKKKLEDGRFCRKCVDVDSRLRKADLMQFIDEVVVADTQNPNSPGMRLAENLGVERAPFFVVQSPGKRDLVYTVYRRFLRDIFDKPSFSTSDGS